MSRSAGRSSQVEVDTAEAAGLLRVHHSAGTGNPRLVHPLVPLQVSEIRRQGEPLDGPAAPAEDEEPLPTGNDGVIKLGIRSAKRVRDNL